MFQYLAQKYQQVMTSLKATLGMHQVQQDKTYISNVAQADFDKFMAGNKQPALSRANFVLCIKHLIGVNGKPVQISADMALAPTRYGFADRAAAQVWINAVELIKD